MLPRVFNIYPVNMLRPCNGCTHCCKGYLTTKVFGQDIGPKPCKFVGGKGCGIYQFRPADPCKIFRCEWNYIKEIPEEFKPNKINVIFMNRPLDNGNKKLLAIPCPVTRKIDDKVMDWMQHAINTNLYEYAEYFDGTAWKQITKEGM